MPLCNLCNENVADLGAHVCDPIKRLAHAYEVKDFDRLPCAPNDRAPLVTALTQEPLLSQVKGIVNKNSSNLMKLVKAVKGDVPARTRQLAEINGLVPANQRVIQLSPALSVLQDEAFITALKALNPTDRIKMETYLRSATAGSGLTILRKSVAGKTDQELRLALFLIAFAGSQNPEVVSPAHIKSLMVAYKNHGPGSNKIPDCAMSAAELKTHFEKHCCNMHRNNRPEEPFWWANTLRYSITSQDVADAGIVLNAAQKMQIFPRDDKLTSVDGAKHLFSNFNTQALADTLRRQHEAKYHTHIRKEFQSAAKAFTSFHGKVQIAARKGLFFFMASYKGETLELMSCYSPDDLDAHWQKNEADKLWDIKT